MQGYHPKEHHSLKTLKQIHLAGAPVKPELYDFMRDQIKHDVVRSNLG